MEASHLQTIHPEMTSILELRRPPSCWAPPLAKKGSMSQGLYFLKVAFYEVLGVSLQKTGHLTMIMMHTGTSVAREERMMLEFEGFSQGGSSTSKIATLSTLASCWFLYPHPRSWEAVQQEIC